MSHHNATEAQLRTAMWSPWPMLSSHILEQFLAVPDLLGVPDHNDMFEAVLIRTHYQYLTARRAFIIKLGITKGYDKKRGHWFPKAPTPCDFVGWTASGRPVAFDAKRHKRSRWRYSDAQSHQLRALKMVKSMGGLAFFLVYHKGAAYIVDPDAVQPGEGIALSDCPIVQFTLACDWLAAFDALERRTNE